MSTDADLPALPDGDLRGALLTGDQITAYTAKQMRAYARTAIEADRARAALSAQPAPGMDAFVLRMLVAAGHVTQAKVDEAYSIAEKMPQPPTQEQA